MQTKKTKLQHLGNGGDLVFAFKKLQFWHNHHLFIYSSILFKKELLSFYCVLVIILLRISFHTTKLGSIYRTFTLLAIVGALCSLSHPAVTTTLSWWCSPVQRKKWQKSLPLITYGIGQDVNQVLSTGNKLSEVMHILWPPPFPKRQDVLIGNYKQMFGPVHCRIIDPKTFEWFH